MWNQIKLLVGRQNALIRKDAQQLRSRFGRFIIIGLIMGALFFNLNLETDGGMYSRGGLIFFMAIFVSLSSFGFLAVIMGNRAIFYKHKESHFYGSASYYLSVLVSDVPLAFIEILIFSLITYWMCGLNAAESGMRFFYFLLLMFITNVTMANFIRAIAFNAANPDAAAGIAPGFIVMFVFFSGFLLSRKEIPPWFIWLHYLSPVKYMVEGLMINEYDGLVFYPPNGTQGLPIEGMAYLDFAYDVTPEDPVL